MSLFSSNAYALEQDKYADYGLYAALGLWGASVLEAVLLGPAQKILRMTGQYGDWKRSSYQLEKKRNSPISCRKEAITQIFSGIQPLYQYDLSFFQHFFAEKLLVV